MKRQAPSQSTRTMSMPLDRSNPHHQFRQPYNHSERPSVRALCDMFHPEYLEKKATADEFDGDLQRPTSFSWCPETIPKHTMISEPAHLLSSPMVCTYESCVDHAEYEWDDHVYCHYHFSMIPATHCASCDHAMVHQFVERHDFPGQRWHPKCYMIFKFWNVRMTSGIHTPLNSDTLYKTQNDMERKVDSVWTHLAAFEESSATCISDLLLHVAASAYAEGFRMASQFVMHLDVLFSTLETVHTLYEERHGQVLRCEVQVNLVCQQVMQFFRRISQQRPGDKMEKKPEACGVTQELLSLVTGLAQNLKHLIRVGLSETLRLEREYGVSDAVDRFLQRMTELDKMRIWMAGRYWFSDGLAGLCIRPAIRDGQCAACLLPVETKCYVVCERVWHVACFVCSECLQPLRESRVQVPDRTQGAKVLCAHCGQGQPSVDVRQVSHLEQQLCRVKCALQHLSLPDDDRWSDRRSSTEIDKEKNKKYPTSTLSSSFLKMMASGWLARRNTTMGHRSINDPHDTSKATNNYTKASANTNSIRRRLSLFSSVRFRDIKRASLSTLDGIKEVSDSDPDEEEDVNKPGQKNYRLVDVGPVSPLSRPGLPSFTQSKTVRVPKETTLSSLIAPSVSDRGERTTVRGLGNSIRRVLTPPTRRKPLQKVFEKPKSHTSPPQLPYTSPSSPSSPKPERLPRVSWPIPANMSDPAPSSPASVETVVTPPRLIELSPTQDATIRHLAILHTKSLVVPDFSLEDLVAMVECKKASLWNKLKVHMGKDTQGARGTFGIPLSILAARNKQAADKSFRTDDADPDVGWFKYARVPVLVQLCVSTLLQMDLSTEGIFRKNGNIRQLKETCDRIDADDFYVAYCKDPSPIQLAALLKRFLRELPEPLLTFRLHPLFLHALRQPTMSETRRLLHLACCMLPKPHRDTMNVLFLFLKCVATHAETNKMDVHNLARVIAPSVLFARPSRDDACQRQSNAPNEIRVVQLLIEHHEEFCMVPPDLVASLRNAPLCAVQEPYESKQVVRVLAQTMTEIPGALSASSSLCLSTCNPSPAATLSAIVTPVDATHRHSDVRRSQTPTPLRRATLALRPSKTTTQRPFWIPRRQDL